MTWTTSFVVSAKTGAEDIKASNLSTPEIMLAADTATRAAVVLLNTGVLGSPDKSYSVRITGHTNPGHEPQSGWSNDHVNIQITQLGEGEVG